MMNEVIRKIAFHYDNLVLEDNDPFRDPPEMKAYMDEWDGPEFIAMLGLTGREKVLEIGCGTGRLAGSIMNSCKEYVGLDVSSVSIERAKVNLAGVPGKAARSFLCGAFPYYPVKRKFDVIFSALTFLHIEDKAAAMACIASLLLPGGRVILSLDKTREEDIVYGDRIVPVFRDTSVRIMKACAGTPLKFAKRIEKEKATLMMLTL